MPIDDAGVRARFAALERAKDDVLAEFARAEALDPGLRAAWTGDAKELYYTLLAAWQARDAAAAGDGAGARALMATSEARLAQVTSELAEVPGARAAECAEALRAAHAECAGAVRAAVEGRRPAAPPSPPAERVVVVGDEAFDLRCAVCGRPAACFRVGGHRYIAGRHVVYEGIAMATVLPVADAPAITAALAADDLAALHAFVRRYSAMEDGIDAYCPTCDRVYCREHYQVVEEYDVGFYDCSYGTCPAGHRRLIDD